MGRKPLDVIGWFGSTGYRIVIDEEQRAMSNQPAPETDAVPLATRYLSDEQIYAVTSVRPRFVKQWPGARALADAATDQGYQVGLAQGYEAGKLDGHDEGEIAAWAEANELGKAAVASDEWRALVAEVKAILAKHPAGYWSRLEDTIAAVEAKFPGAGTGS